MNELERLIAAVDRPEPGKELDDRVNALFAQVQLPSKRPRWKSTLLSCGTAACVGLLGFYLGRQSIIAAADAPVATSSASEVDPRRESTSVAASVMKIPLHDDQLVSMFMHPSNREGLLGSGPVRIVTATSP